MDVTRDEFNRVVDTLNSLGHLMNDVRHDQDVQFKRIAQLQAEIDQLRTLRERQ